MKRIILFVMFSITSLFAADPSEQMVLGAGCFWCVEAIYEQVPATIG